MVTKAKGLGKGLDSLIPSSTKKTQSGKNEKSNITSQEKRKPEKNKPELQAGVQEIRLSEIEPNRAQPRKNFDEDALLELADSIKQFGVIQPLIVQKKGNHYEIIAGERRWRAAKQAGVKKVPVIIKEYTPQEVMEISLIENIQREDLNPIEEALAYKNLIEEYRLKQDEVAERVSKSRTAVTNSIRLLKLGERVQQMVVEDMISTGHARALLSLEDPEVQLTIANRIFDEKLSVRETEKLVRDIQKPKTDKKKIEKVNSFIYKDIEEKIRAILGTKVTVDHKADNKGKITIEYYSNEELERIVDLMNSIK